MYKYSLKKCLIGIALVFTSISSYATSIEGYWKSIDDRTGEQLSIVEIRKGTDGYYHGKIVYRYSNSHGIKLENCIKCPAPYTNHPILGLEILSNLKDKTNRKANFKTVICLNLHGEQHLFTGIINGKIIEERIGTNGFGYDPIFVADSYQKTFAELTLEEKARISHRGIAVQKLIHFLQQNLLV